MTTANTTEELLCSVCNEKYEKWNEGINVCISCCYGIHVLVDDTLDNIDKDIRIKYRISEVINKPIKTCNCTSTDIIPFDYFTPKHEGEDKYFLVLTGICRICEGYKVLKLEDTEFSLMIRQPPTHLGIHINGEKLNLDYYA